MMTLAELEPVVRLMEEEAGVHIREASAPMAVHRLERLVMDREDLTSVDDIVRRLRHRASRELKDAVVEALLVHETSFFRDAHPFEALRRDALPQLMRAREASRQLRIWSAACSSGQEAYSVAMLIQEDFPALKGWRLDIRATDLSREVIARAERGRFAQMEVNRGLPAALLVKYFRREGLMWSVRPDLRAMIRFEVMNLLEPDPSLGSQDLIMLRNVLIYLGVEARRLVLERIVRRLHPSGLLLLGSTEASLDLHPNLEPVSFGRSVFFRRRS